MAKVLVVDDEKFICEEFRDLMAEDGHDVDIAFNGQEALKKVAERDYHVIFLDVLLPRMEGRQIFEEIKKIKKVPVVFMSGYLPPNKEKEALSLGALACLKKPLDLEQVKKIIDDASR
ncbi:MAG TPA: response regulator [Verrucomicrobiae bacterium]|jgi:DNA-binding NtrC family response regulator|nr:response regulator [Verrucomicrobiae bacterium]